MSPFEKLVLRGILLLLARLQQMSGAPNVTVAEGEYLGDLIKELK